METTKTEKQLRKQYRRIVNNHNYAIHQAQRAHDKERLAVLDVRGARIDKTLENKKNISL